MLLLGYHVTRDLHYRFRPPLNTAWWLGGAFDTHVFKDERPKQAKRDIYMEPFGF